MKFIGKSTLDELSKYGKIVSTMNTENKENIKDPKAPDKVFFGLIDVSFFHLKIFPKTYPPTSEQTQSMMTHNKIDKVITVLER